MIRCSLFGHKWPHDMTFFPDPPKQGRILEIALTYSVCERCRLVKVEEETLQDLIRRIKRARDEMRQACQSRDDWNEEANLYKTQLMQSRDREERLATRIAQLENGGVTDRG